MTSPSQPFPLAPSPSAAADGVPERRACLFTLGGARFAVDVRHTRELAMFQEITRVPGSPATLVGVANLRGTVMPIVDIRRLLDLPAEPTSGGVRTLVLRSDPLQAAVVVDAVLGLEPLDEIEPAPSGGPADAAPARGRFTAGYVRWGAGSVSLLDAPKILEALRPRQIPPGRGAVEG